MNDKDVIQHAHESELAHSYDVFVQAYTAALGDAQREKEAETRFQNAVKHLRFLRDRALALLPQATAGGRHRAAAGGSK